VLGMLVAVSLLMQGTAGVRTGIVTGQLHMASGAPAAAVRVFALGAPPPGVRPEDGTQYYTVPPPASTTMTDADGRFRLTNIPAGRYYIVAGLLGQASYYPGVADADRATVVPITPGSTTNVEFPLAIPLGGRVTGRVTPAPAANVQERAVLSGVKITEVLEAPITPEGTFDFGHLPRGSYLLNVFPAPPGMSALAFEVGDSDISSLQFIRLPLHTVSGRLVVENGPLPWALLAFSTPETYVAAAINPDLTFTAHLHSAKHETQLGGMPSGYYLRSVRIGARDVTQGFDVGDADVSNVVITVAAPKELPRVRGRITGGPRPAGARVEMTGPIVQTLGAMVRDDGSFEFPAVTPGVYKVTVPQAPQLAPTSIVVGWDGADVQLTLPR
jgi:hypothetical protein